MGGMREEIIGFNVINLVVSEKEFNIAGLGSRITG